MKLINDDCMNVLPINNIDIIIIDPPYKNVPGGSTKSNQGGIFKGEYAKKGTLFKHNDIKPEKYAKLLYLSLKKSGHLYCFVNDRSINMFLNEFKKAGFILNNILVWIKDNMTQNIFYMKQCEYILFYRKCNAIPIKNTGISNVMYFNNVKNKLHPTEKPIKLLKLLIENSSNKNDIVLDIFAGSGSTAVAAKELNRKYIMIEIDREYYEIMKHRLNNTYSTKNTLFDGV